MVGSVSQPQMDYMVFCVFNYMGTLTKMSVVFSFYSPVYFKHPFSFKAIPAVSV